jgi:copper chaperone
MEQVTLTAPDISCDHCINAIKKSVTELPGVEWVSGDPEKKQVVLRYEPATTPLTKITAAMEEEGYPATA